MDGDQGVPPFDVFGIPPNPFMNAFQNAFAAANANVNPPLPQPGQMAFPIHFQQQAPPAAPAFALAPAPGPALGPAAPPAACACALPQPWNDPQQWQHLLEGEDAHISLAAFFTQMQRNQSALATQMDWERMHLGMHSVDWARKEAGYAQDVETALGRLDIAERNSREDRRERDEAVEGLREAEEHLVRVRAELAALRRRLERAERQKRAAVAEAQREREERRTAWLEVGDLGNAEGMHRLEIEQLKGQLQLVKTAFANKGVHLAGCTAEELERALENVRAPPPVIRLRFGGDGNAQQAGPSNQANAAASTSQSQAQPQPQAAIEPAAASAATPVNAQAGPSIRANGSAAEGNANKDEHEDEDEDDEDFDLDMDHPPARATNIPHPIRSNHARRPRRDDPDRDRDRPRANRYAAGVGGPSRRHALDEEIRRLRRERGRRLLGRTGRWGGGEGVRRGR